jgi:hypothetical protein
MFFICHHLSIDFSVGYYLYRRGILLSIITKFSISMKQCRRTEITNIVETSVHNKCQCSFYCALFTLHVSAPIGGHLL